MKDKAGKYKSLQDEVLLLKQKLKQTKRFVELYSERVQVELESKSK